jgi:hypothetical protein
LGGGRLVVQRSTSYRALWILPLFLAVVAWCWLQSRGLERQQLKWFQRVALQAFLGGSLLVTLATHLSPYQPPRDPDHCPYLPSTAVGSRFSTSLYDIDIVISRGLVYAAGAPITLSLPLVVVVAVGFAVGTVDVRPPLSVAMAIVVLLVEPVKSGCGGWPAGWSRRPS